MKTLSALFIVLFSALTAFADSPEYTRFDEVLGLIVARNANQTCEKDAYQDTIIEMAARAIAENYENPAHFERFKSRIPKDSDILENLLFRALLENVDLENLTDSKKWQNLLTNTTFYSRAGGVFGPAYLVELKEKGNAVISQRVFTGDEIQVKKTNATWSASVEIEPGADYYQFIEINSGKTKLLYLLKRNVQGTLLIEETSLKPSDDRSIFFFSPDDCSV